MTFGERLREFRLASKLTQGQLSRLTGVPSSSISRIETDDRKMTLDEAVRFAEILGVSVGDLAGRTTDKPCPALHVVTPWLHECVGALTLTRQMAERLQTLYASMAQHGVPAATEGQTDIFLPGKYDFLSPTLLSVASLRLPQYA